MDAPAALVALRNTDWSAIAYDRASLHDRRPAFRPSVSNEEPNVFEEFVYDKG